MPWAQAAETLAHSPIEAHSPQHGLVHRESLQPQERKMSTVALLPSSPLDLSRRPFHSSGVGYPSSSSGPLRPKLSLNTTCPQQRTLGKGNTGLRLDTLSADTPTIRNTYKNSYCADATREHSPKPPTPHPLNQDAQPRASPKLSSSASPLPSPKQVQAAPYALGKHPRSILTNGPHRKRPKSRGSDDVATAASKAAEDATRRVSFPDCLSEEIHTKQYVARHIDLLSQPSPSPADAGSGGATATAALEEESSKSDASSDESTDDDEAGPPRTPVAGRKKRRRDWVWTLGPIESAEADGGVEEKPEVPRIAVPRAPNKRPK